MFDNVKSAQKIQKLTVKYILFYDNHERFTGSTNKFIDKNQGKV